MPNGVISNAGQVEKKTKATVSFFDFVAILIILIGGSIFLWNAPFWGIAYIGKSQYGDAEFWWNGAIHFAKGIFTDNPGRGFRPGYFLIAGATLPVLGASFLVFHKFSLLIFLSTASAFFLTLRAFLGALGAFCAVCLFVFNPYTAEWLATSTTDGLGLLLHLGALICLIRAFSSQSLRSLAGFGFLFALATLTRPLITPFIGVATLLVLLGFTRNWRKNIQAAVVLAVSFFFLLAGWMGIQKLMIGEWSISNNDASAFYAASDPEIQVWNNQMYTAVETAASLDFHTSSLTSPQIGREFWKLTLKNYGIHWRYHLKRILPHFWMLAHLSPLSSAHGSIRFRIIFYELFLLGCLVALFLQKKGQRYLKTRICAIMLFATFAVKFPIFFPLLLLCGVGFALIQAITEKAITTGLILSLFWIVGVFTLALVGGTSGFFPDMQINTLGCRLASQFFFVGDVLALFLLYRILGSPKLNFVERSLFDFSRPVQFGYAGVLISVLLIEVAGLAMVGSRWIQRRFSTPVSFPALAPDHSKFPLWGEEVDRNELTNVVMSKQPVWVTGMVSDFIWNLKGQDRAQAVFYLQKDIRPLAMNPNRVLIEFPNQVDEDDWAETQGAFLLRNITDSPPLSTLPYSTSQIAVQEFVPLSEDHRSFDLIGAKKYPLKISASQLVFHRALWATEGKLDLNSDFDEQTFQRRVKLVPDAKTRHAELRLNLSIFQGSRKLYFSWDGTGSAQIRVKGKDHDVSVRNLTTVDLSDPLIKEVQIDWSGIPENGIFIYELNLITDASS